MNILQQLEQTKKDAQSKIDALDVQREDLLDVIENASAKIEMLKSMLSTTQEAFNTLMLSQKTGAITDDDFRTFAQETGLELLPEFETGEEIGEEDSEEEAAGID